MNDKITSIDFEKIFQTISMKWFYTKPLLFKLMCLYELKGEYGIDCDFRTNGKIIEYNPEVIADKNLQSVKDSLELELCRILLRHPYRKKPHNTDEEIWYKASTITITQKSLSRYKLPENQNIEFYYAELMKQKNLLDTDSQGGSSSNISTNQDKNNNDSESEENSNNSEQVCDEDGGEKNQGNKNENSDLITSTTTNKKGPTAYWGKDEVTEKSIEALVSESQTVNLWGNLPANIELQLRAAVQDFKYYKKVMSYFKSSTGNSDRVLTRMRPNRRSGFLQMGSRYKACPGKILVALDTSESVSDECLQKFYGALKSIYVQGIKKIEVIQFDYKLLTEKPEKFTRQAFYKIKGRGGTSYQSVFDFVIKNRLNYDGLIIFTDGFAPPPKVKNNSVKVLWMLTQKNGCHAWMKNTGICGYL